MNETIKEKYLPVGTVVLLRNGTKRVMINGFCTMDASKPDKVYDYSGVLFPEGSLSSDQTLLFDHEQIVRVDHLGLEDDEEKTTCNEWPAIFLIQDGKVVYAFRGTVDFSNLIDKLEEIGL